MRSVTSPATRKQASPESTATTSGTGPRGPRSLKRSKGSLPIPPPSPCIQLILALYNMRANCVIGDEQLVAALRLFLDFAQEANINVISLALLELEEILSLS